MLVFFARGGARMAHSLRRCIGKSRPAHFAQHVVVCVCSSSLADNAGDALVIIELVASNAEAGV